MPDPPYRDERLALRQQLSRAEEELAKYRAEAAQQFACSACGTRNDHEARFCQRCGGALSSEGGRVDLGRIRTRSPLLVAIASAQTLSLYNIFLVYRWSTELNEALGEERRSPGGVALISTVTLGLGGLVYECLIART